MAAGYVVIAIWNHSPLPSLSLLFDSAFVRNSHPLCKARFSRQVMYEVKRVDPRRLGAIERRTPTSGSLYHWDGAEQIDAGEREVAAVGWLVCFISVFEMGRP